MQFIKFSGVRERTDKLEIANHLSITFIISYSALRYIIDYIKMLHINPYFSSIKANTQREFFVSWLTFAISTNVSINKAFRMP